MKNNKINKSEQVEVMALFGYEMTPCRPLSFKRRSDRAEIEVTELLRTHVKFVGRATHHFFDVLVGRRKFQLEFNSADLSWRLMPIR